MLVFLFETMLVASKQVFFQARDTGKSVMKWVMVNIQNVAEFSCQVMNRDVWSQKRIKTLVKENFLFLQVILIILCKIRRTNIMHSYTSFQLYMDSEEGQRYMTFYKVNQWPYVAVLDPRTGELMVEWNYSDASTYETLINEFLATSSWGDEEKADCHPSEPKKKRMVIIRFMAILDYCISLKVGQISNFFLTKFLFRFLV